MKHKLFYIPFFVLLFTIIGCENNTVTSLQLNKEYSYLTIGQIDTLYASISTKGDLNKIPVKWSSSNPDVVKFKNGKLTALKTGSSIVTVEAGDKKTNCNVYVSSQIQLTSLNYGILLHLGDYYKNGKSNIFVFGLADEDDTLYVEFNAPIKQTKMLNIQSYNFVDSDTTLNAVRRAFVDSRNYVMGSYVVSKSQHVKYKVWIHPILEGKVEILNSQLNQDVYYDYSIKIDCKDDYENTLTYSFVGMVKRIDYSLAHLISPSPNENAPLDVMRKCMKQNLNIQTNN